MRYAFGLGGLLVCLGVIVWIMGAPGGELDQTKAALDAKKKVEPQIQQFTGHSADGTAADKSAVLQPQFNDNGGKFKGLLVASVTPGGAYDAMWGIKPFDLIIQIGPHDLPHDTTIDPDMATALMVDALRMSQQLVVVRAGQHVTLPLSPAPVAGGSTAAPHSAHQSLQDQLNAIQNAPTH